MRSATPRAAMTYAGAVTYGPVTYLSLKEAFLANIFAKTMRWLLFGVVLSLVPLAYSYISLSIKDKSPTLQAILSDGGLLLVVSSICAAALGEMIGSTRKYLIFKLVCSGATMVLLLLSTLVFASIAEARLTNHVNEVVIENTSLIIFISAIISSAACIARSET